MCTFPPCRACQLPYLEHGPGRPGCTHYRRPTRGNALADALWALWALAEALARR